MGEEQESVSYRQCLVYNLFFFFSSRRRHTRLQGDWSSDVCSSDLDGRLKGVILSGSHASVYEVDDRAPDAVFELGIPVLGICYGMQAMATQLGGKEIGRASCRERV